MHCESDGKRYIVWVNICLDYTRLFDLPEWSRPEAVVLCWAFFWFLVG